MTGEYVISVKGLEKVFEDGNAVLRGVDLDISQGEKVVILGASGSGKSTLLRCLNYLETIDEGTVTLNGTVIQDGESIELMKDDEIRNNRLNFGLVFQSFNLFPQIGRAHV